ncbi:enoyl-CoA hydratase/isomerase family protein (plasmid) [Halococcus dombrowskii]|uniref:Enoyl-CoA hydratase/isomerase family protein n=1 Tax=Halococcus dombrowskii TaxID=179637 RepID=A0AAV3SFU0_HALDO|nr:enoyl-CoA hydratase/isomerase family protein [Halococcus dombrowskii]UOO96959.1 enoyl-CoA hydratase/isomerase family protein [Halococcus dombrowskii]
MRDHDKVAVDHDEDSGIAFVRLDNPPQNVIDLELLLDLKDALDEMDTDDAIDAIILGTAQDVFCSGADLDEISGLDAEEGNRWLTAYMDTVDRLRDTGKPTIAAVERTCVAGGNELVMGCDLIVAGESATFGQPEVLVGSTAAGGGLQLLPLIVGEKRAREMLLTGDLLSAEEAERFGLVNRVVEDATTDDKAVKLALDIIENSSPQAYRMMKAVMKSWTNLAMHHREMAREMTAAVWNSTEFDERAREFLTNEELDPRSFTGVRPK